jgi:CRP/FNR family transcriptional regulator, cyclic AMP receptor protein
MDEKRLEGIPLFAALSKKERRRVSQLADEVDVPAGKELVHEGGFAYEFFVIEDGSAEVTRQGKHVADLGAGDFFGEMAALSDGTRNAAVKSTSPLTAVVMTAHDFRVMAKEMPSVAAAITAAVEERSRSLSPS